MKKQRRIGIDFGGTKTEILCLEANGKEVYRHRAPTIKGSYEKTLDSMTDLVLQAEKTIGAQATVGMGIPGNICPTTGVVLGANTDWIVGKSFRPDLEERLGRTVRMTNDANCFAVSEAVDGAGKGYKTVFAAILGTGCGAGLVVNGNVVEGRHDSAGEWGHNPLPYARLYAPERMGENEGDIQFFTDDKKWDEYPGPKCLDCGKRGCLEGWIAGPGMKRDYADVYGEEISTHDIIDQARNGTKNSKETVERYLDRVARAFAGVINTIDPDIIVLGGGMSNVDEIYSEVPKIWQKYIYANNITTEIKPARHGDSSGVRGAAWLWKK